MAVLTEPTAVSCLASFPDKLHTFLHIHLSSQQATSSGWEDRYQFGPDQNLDVHSLSVICHFATKGHDCTHLIDTGFRAKH